MKKSPKVTMTTRVDPKLKIIVRRIAKLEGVTASYYIEKVLVDACLMRQSERAP